MGLLGWAGTLVVWMEDGGEGARKAASWVDTGQEMAPRLCVLSDAMTHDN